MPDGSQAAAEGRSFVTNGPLLLLEVDGSRPGGIIRLSGTGPHRVRVDVRVKSHVAPVQTVQIIAGGKVVWEQNVAAEEQQGRWIDVDRTIELDGSSWIAARAFGVARSGAPDAEAHTNPVYVDIGDKAPYNRDSLDRVIAHLDQQMAIHRKRSFAEKARVLDDFQKSRDILLRIRQAGGLPAGGVPDAWIDDNSPTAAIDPSRRDAPGRRAEPVPATAAGNARRPKHSRHSKPPMAFRCSLWRRSRWCKARSPRPSTPTATCTSPRCATIRTSPSRAADRWARCGCLRDRDGDGRFDESHIFADGLLWAAGIAPWKDGVFVTAPPDIWYLKDTDGDGKADVREKCLHRLWHPEPAGDGE